MSRPGEGRIARLAASWRRLDSRPELIAATRRARRHLPGDSLYGDPLSTAGDRAPELLGRQLAAIGGQRASVVRELGFGALQLWQGISEAQGRGFGERELAIMFTDLVDFSSWALSAGDASALELLRAVDLVLAGCVESHGGIVVKRLGDGLMAVFTDADAAVRAAHEAHTGLAHIEADGGYRPRLRIGIHAGRPRKLGGDYFGVDVNIAARLAGAAGPGEVLVSEPLRGRLGGGVELSRRATLDAKGAPAGFVVYLAEPAPAASSR